MVRAEVPNTDLEAVIFSAGGPASVAHIRRVFPQLTPAQIAEKVSQLNEALRETGRPYEIAEVAGGYQFRTRPLYGELLRQAMPERRVRLSRAALETLSVIAYKQPLTRAEIEELRCVDCGAVLRGLLDRNLARIVGRRDAPGRPALYGTSAGFLETFGLKSLRDLPALREIVAMDSDEGTPVERGDDSGFPAADGVSPDVGDPSDDSESAREARAP